MPVLPTLFVMIIGGAILGALTALVPQILGVPVAMDDSDTDEVEIVKKRLGNAMAIPVAGLILLLLLVLPFAYALLQSNEMAPGFGGPAVAIITAGGILGFAALAGTKPQIRISFGDLVWALVGIGTVLVIIISVLLYSTDEKPAEQPASEGAAVVQMM
jgi:ABC-type transport system involved in cytochrome c biogenesis permease subunit